MTRDEAIKLVSKIGHVNKNSDGSPQVNYFGNDSATIGVDSNLTREQLLALIFFIDEADKEKGNVK